MAREDLSWPQHGIVWDGHIVLYGLACRRQNIGGFKAHHLLSFVLQPPTPGSGIGGRILDEDLNKQGQADDVIESGLLLSK